MKDTERRRLETFLRVREFLAAHAAQVPTNSFVTEKTVILNQAINALEGHASEQVTGRTEARAGSIGTAAARDELLMDLKAISRTARSMEADTPGISEKFRVPYSKSNQDVLAVARAAANDVLPYKAEFIRRGLPANFLEDLQADIAEMEAAISKKEQGSEKRATATAGIDEEIERGMTALRQMDPVMRNIYTSDPSTLAAWFRASHVERSPRGSQPPAPHTTALPPTTQSS